MNLFQLAVPRCGVTFHSLLLSHQSPCADWTYIWITRITLMSPQSSSNTNICASVPSVSHGKFFFGLVTWSKFTLNVNFQGWWQPFFIPQLSRESLTWWLWGTLNYASHIPKIVATLKMNKRQNVIKKYLCATLSVVYFIHKLFRKSSQ